MNKLHTFFRAATASSIILTLGALILFAAGKEFNFTFLYITIFSGATFCFINVVHSSSKFKQKEYLESTPLIIRIPKKLEDQFENFLFSRKQELKFSFKIDKFPSSSHFTIYCTQNSHANTYYEIGSQWRYVTESPTKNA